jgi:hypothetical protein
MANTDFLLVDGWPPFFQGRMCEVFAILPVTGTLAAGITNQGTILRLYAKFYHVFP